MARLEPPPVGRANCPWAQGCPVGGGGPCGRLHSLLVGRGSWKRRFVPEAAASIRSSSRNTTCSFLASHPSIAAGWQNQRHHLSSGGVVCVARAANRTAMLGSLADAAVAVSVCLSVRLSGRPSVSPCCPALCRRRRLVCPSLCLASVDCCCDLLPQRLVALKGFFFPLPRNRAP